MITLITIPIYQHEMGYHNYSQEHTILFQVRLISTPQFSEDNYWVFCSSAFHNECECDVTATMTQAKWSEDRTQGQTHNDLLSAKRSRGLEVTQHMHTRTCNAAKTHAHVQREVGWQVL